ncbi:hypothetical protein [Veillonella caviae]|uniref:hypothetical protein n=1 Tax=Veillonella caviae TaxID=248316 RepID=UPI0023F76D7E|nr:hypothetical protein [Veillonella caviae]MCI7693790.1 hypothetical protein [Veillonella caviae]MDD7290493.1 hypothetical protein [Veillonella caviae]MDY5254050.1 hypothetical protein [Veillonella caviae]MDY5715224.1 hypothetical protein [Veillonella caviae]MDY5788147.1 hypothetical protein [Veillonella caviae]
MSDYQIESLRIAILRNLDDNGSVEALIRILENGATLGYAQEGGNPSRRKMQMEVMQLELKVNSMVMICF